MIHHSWTADETAEPTRADRFLAQHLTGVSRAYLETYFEKGQVLVNKRPARKSQLIQPGDTVDLRNFLPPDERRLAPAPKIKLDVLKETDDYLLIHKPAGLASHAISFDDTHTLANALLAHYPETASVGDDPLRPGVAHRLDTDTSGTLLVARTQEAFVHFREQFHQRKVYKEYRAIVVGVFPFLNKTIQVPLAHHPKAIHKMIAVKNARDFERLRAKDAVTRVERLEIFEDHSYLKVIIETGRMHQIRVHLSEAGFPVSGDGIYRQQGFAVRDWLKSKRQLLHAYHLRLLAPNGEEIDMQAPLPADFANALAQLRERK